MKLQEVEALIAVGRVGFALAASRLMSLVMGFGTVALAAYTVQSPSWEAVCAVAAVALCGLLPALAFESRSQARRAEELRHE